MTRKITFSSKAAGMTRRLKNTRKITPVNRLPTGKAAVPLENIPIITDAMYQQDVAPHAEGFDVLAKKLASRLPAWTDARKSAGSRAATLLRTMRNAAGLSQIKLGELARINQSDISALENGDGPQGPSFDMIARIADACGFHLTFEAKPALDVPAALAMVKALEQAVSSFNSALVRLNSKRVVRTFAMDDSGRLEEFEGTSPVLRNDGTIILGDSEGHVYEVNVEAPKAKVTVKEATPSVAAAWQHAQSAE